MNYEHLTILLPCHSLEDFPLHHAADDAANMLHAWTALWHPALIHAVQDVPGWFRADDPPQELAGRLVVVPNSAAALLLAGWAKRAVTEGAVVVRDFATRDDAVRDALAPLDNCPNVDPDLVEDFLALGYTYLQEELLTRQMRYMSNLDEAHFRSETIAAANAACSGDIPAAKEKLRACFDVLAEARDRFYPVDAYLIDLMLLADSSDPAVVMAELQRGAPVNVLASARLLQQFAEKNQARGAEVLTQLRQAMADGTCTLVGGELSEGLLPLEPPEMTGARLRQAADLYRELLGAAPAVYARRRFGLAPTLPQTLARNGLKSALHFTLDDGQFPRGEQARIRWRGSAPAGVDALARIPLDVARPETFLGLCERMSETMDLDHVATLVFARWPGQHAPWFDDLHRAGKYAPVLGRFVTLDKYFGVEASIPGNRFTADRYRSPYHKQAIIRRESNPVSRVSEPTSLRHTAEDLNTIAVLGQLLSANFAAGLGEVAPQQLLSQVDAAGLESGTAEALDLAAVKQQLQSLQKSLPQKLADAWPSSTPRAAARSPGVFVVNPLLTSRRVAVDVSGLAHLPEVAEGSPVLAVQERPPLALVDLPACGYAWLSAGSSQPEQAAPAARRGWFRRKTVENPPLAEEDSLTLRNEFVEVQVDPHTGAIKSVRDYHHRGNRMSQQLALRSKGAARDRDDDSDPRDDGEYSVMAADKVQVTASGAVRGEIVSSGRLLDKQGKQLAGFRQVVQVTRGNPIIRLQIKLDIQEEPRPDPWNSYYACRFAWPDVSLMWRKSLGMWAVETEQKRLEAPLFVEGDTGHERTAIMCHGLPFHRVVEERILDTMLVCRGEQQREFELGIGVDLNHPVRDALAFMSAGYQAASTLAAPGGPTSGWLFHVDAPNLVATHWEAIIESGKAVGFRVRLMETEEKPTRTRLRAMRSVKRARLVDFVGSPLSELEVEGDAIKLEVDAHEWVEVEAHWS